MSPQTKWQWLGFAIHTAVVYTVGKLGPKLIIEVAVDLFLAALKMFKKKEKSK